MTVLYLDTFSGISGDMLLGLLVDLGVELDAIRAELSKLPVSGYQLTAQADKRHSIGGTRVTVDCHGDQPHRTWKVIDAMLATSALDERVKTDARQVFQRLGESEARVHRTELNLVHFHEVGAVDAIVDIVGSIVGLKELGADKIVCAPLPLSHGLTRGSHGALPLPAPATLELLKGQPVRDADCERELVTPTGAALAASLASFGPLPEMSLQRIGYGVGGWQLDDRPNLLRGMLGEVANLDGLEQDRVSVIETHLDDCSPEWLGALMDRLLANSALDVGFSPLQMKKNRPGTRVTIIAAPQEADRLARLVLHESSAIGVRIHEARRAKLRRQQQTIDTDLGAVDVKLIFDGETLLRVTPEHDSCRRVAEASGRSLPEVFRIAAAAANRRFGLE